jgi:predicted ATPase
MHRPDPGQQALRFVASPWRHMVVLGDHPLVILERGLPWDDHGYKTLFQVYYYEPGREGGPRRLGAVKILQRGSQVTRLPLEEVDGLDESFCSLGQDLDYYENVRELGQEIAPVIWRGLRDMVVDSSIHEAFKTAEGVEKSLLRSSAARMALRDAGRLLQGQRLVPTEPFGFDFSCELQRLGFSEPHRLRFEFFPQDGQLGHIMALVGKNATGKSALLRALARRLSGLDTRAGVFSPEPPVLRRIIVIAYSAFDPYTFFHRDRPEDGVAYRYCGLRNKAGKLDIDRTFELTARRLARLPEGKNKDRLRDVMQRSGIFNVELHLQDPFETGDFAGFVSQMKSLSSGHQIFLFVLTNLMATIRPGSLVLFDEPELHLHPNMLASLMRLLHAVLEDFESYAILATHSPQVLQEIPARSIRIIEREGSLPDQRPYPRESFGANLGEISELAFGIDEQERNYQRLLQESAQALGREWLEQRADQVFERPLSLASRMLLSRLRQTGGGDEEPEKK